jgi:CrcB protein
VHDRFRNLLPTPALRTYHAAGEFRRAHDMSLAQPWLLVMLGSAIGGAARLWLSTAVARPLGTRFPWGTLTVNLLGCLLVGILGAVLAPPGRLHDAQPLRIFLIVGVLGGFTTFSAFALDALMLVQRGAAGAAAVYVLASVLGCLLAAGVAYAAVATALR